MSIKNFSKGDNAVKVQCNVTSESYVMYDDSEVSSKYHYIYFK